MINTPTSPRTRSFLQSRPDPAKTREGAVKPAEPAVPKSPRAQWAASVGPISQRSPDQQLRSSSQDSLLSKNSSRSLGGTRSTRHGSVQMTNASSLSSDHDPLVPQAGNSPRRPQSVPGGPGSASPSLLGARRPKSELVRSDSPVRPVTLSNDTAKTNCQYIQGTDQFYLDGRILSRDQIFSTDELLGGDSLLSEDLFTLPAMDLSFSGMETSAPTTPPSSSTTESPSPPEILQEYYEQSYAENHGQEYNEQYLGTNGHEYSEQYLGTNQHEYTNTETFEGANQYYDQSGQYYDQNGQLCYTENGQQYYVENGQQQYYTENGQYYDQNGQLCYAENEYNGEGQYPNQYQYNEHGELQYNEEQYAGEQYAGEQYYNQTESSGVNTPIHEQKPQQLAAPQPFRLLALSQALSQPQPGPIEFIENDIEHLIDDDLCSLLDNVEFKPQIFPIDQRYDSTNVVYTETGELKGASYDQLIIILSDPKAILDIDDFLLTYRSFSKPRQLLTSLIDLSNSTECTGEVSRAIHLRLFNVLGKWIEKYWFDFETDQSCTTTTFEFLANVMANTSTEEHVKLSRVALSVKKKLDRKVENKLVEKQILPQNCPVPIMDKNIDPRTAPLLAFDSQEIARQMTISTWKNWSAIKPWEFLELAWTKKAGKAKHVELMTDKFNFTSNWVTTTLITTPRLADRVKVLKKFLEIAHYLRTFGNFNGLMEIWSGLQRQPVYRMQKTFGEVMREKRYAQWIAEFKEVTSHDRSYANLRAAIQGTNPPVIPYLGMYLSDLVFIEEGNPSKLGENNLINYWKCRSIAAAIKKVQQYQQKGYAFTLVTAIEAKLKRQLIIENEDEMYQISNYHEPREGKEPGLKPPCLEQYESKKTEFTRRTGGTAPFLQSKGSFINRAKPLSAEFLATALGKNTQKKSLSKEEQSELPGLAERIASASWKGDIVVCKELICHPLATHFINTPNNRGQTALYCACRQGREDVLIELLNCGMCDVNLQMGEHRSTALHAAAYGGHGSSIALLFCMGADDTIQNKQGLIARQEATTGVVELFALKQKGYSTLRSLYPIVNQLRSPVLQ